MARMGGVLFCIMEMCFAGFAFWRRGCLMVVWIDWSLQEC